MAYIHTTAVKEGYLQVSKKHKIYYATYGNTKGIPVVVLHGGPGAGCDDQVIEFFNLKDWYVVIFDQRGAMRSIPFACMEENNTQALIADIELLKNHLNIKQWVCFGGSWGSLLALLYGQAFPESCLGFILRSVFLGRKKDYTHLLYNMENIFPAAYQEFLDYFPKEEQKNLINACYQRIMNPNPTIHMSIAKAYLKYIANRMTPIPDPIFIKQYLQNDRLVLSMERAFFHYVKHEFFIKENQILSCMNKINHLPAIIIHGKKDIICNEKQAWQLHENWKNSKLRILQNVGHAPISKDFKSALFKATNSFKKMITKE